MKFLDAPYAISYIPSNIGGVLYNMVAQIGDQCRNSSLWLINCFRSETGLKTMYFDKLVSSDRRPVSKLQPVTGKL
jgi:hypothetical protein